MNIRIEYLNYKEWAAKRKKDAGKAMGRALLYNLKKVIDNSKRKYLSGGYPLNLRVDSGSLRNNVRLFNIRTEENEVIANIGVESIAWYGKIWEAVDEYKHRRGRSFGNATPMARPFLKPSWEDMKNVVVRDLHSKLIEALK